MRSCVFYQSSHWASNTISADWFCRNYTTPSSRVSSSQFSCYISSCWTKDCISLAPNCTSAAGACAWFAGTLWIPAPILKRIKLLKICIYTTIKMKHHIHSLNKLTTHYFTSRIICLCQNVWWMPYSFWGSVAMGQLTTCKCYTEALMSDFNIY